MAYRSLADLYLSSATKFKDRPALSVGGAFYTYGELLDRALRLKFPALPSNSLCAVWAERELSAYVGILGAVVHGHAYLPLSPTSPPVRNAEIIRKSGAKVLIVNSAQWAQVAPVRVLLPPDFEIVNTDDLHDVPAAPKLGGPIDRAYMMYTSGSTGVPRGVEIRNSQIRTYLQNASKIAPVVETDRVSQMFDLTFDLSVHDLFMCWAGGACLFVPTLNERIAPHEFIDRNSLTYWFSVPSVISLIANYGLNPRSFSSLRMSLFCGESLRLNQAEAWQKAAPHSKVINLYGPTEGTVAISHYIFDEQNRAHRNGVVSIGHIFPDHVYRLIDDELLLQGPQIIKQYFGEKPYDGDWYKTGDLVREEDGCLFFLGRSDSQIKLRGYRVELNEVAFAVSSAANGLAAVALAWPSRETPANIYVFVESKEVNEKDLLEECARRLPTYMIPSAIFGLEKFPLNERGKTDRLKLSAELDKLIK